MVDEVLAIMIIISSGSSIVVVTVHIRFQVLKLEEVRLPHGHVDRVDMLKWCWGCW